MDGWKRLKERWRRREGKKGVQAIPEQVVWRAVWGLLKGVPE